MGYYLKNVRNGKSAPGYNLTNAMRNGESMLKISKWPSLRPLAFKSKLYEGLNGVNR